jgi:hypothetical protein
MPAGSDEDAIEDATAEDATAGTGMAPNAECFPILMSCYEL